MTTLVIARHGNTFEDNEIPRRVGVRTDMPLTEKGFEQARAMGKYLHDNDMRPDAIFTSALRRARDTGWIAMIEARLALHIQKDAMLNEIDYGPDENKTEAEVIARVGEKALRDWDENATPPPGWDIRPHEVISWWVSFADRIAHDYPDCTILAVTSNGIARFAPYITGNYSAFRESNDIKLKTGALGIFDHIDGKWVPRGWNIRPDIPPV